MLEANGYKLEDVLSKKVELNKCVYEENPKYGWYNIDGVVIGIMEEETTIEKSENKINFSKKYAIITDGRKI